LLLAWPDRSFEKAQVYLLSIELFQRSDRAMMMARWDASCGSYFVHVPKVLATSIIENNEPMVDFKNHKEIAYGL
jgi:hypothetical protein